MLVSNFSGNLADSLIQYIITRLVADEKGYSYGFNPTFHFDYHNGYNQLSFLDLDYGQTYDCGFYESPEGVVNTWTEKYIPFDYENGDHNDWHPYQPDIFEVEDNTKLVLRFARDYKYFNGRMGKIKDMVKIKEDAVFACKKFLPNVLPLEDDNLCLINYRGGEFRGVNNLLLKPEYYKMAVQRMLDINPKMHFAIITDDAEYANKVFPNYDCFHFGIAADYYTIHNAKNLILSNSGFAVIPTLTSNTAKNIIAPKYWARWNVSNGYWCPGEMYYPGWNYMDRNGILSSYSEIYNEQFEKGLR